MLALLRTFSWQDLRHHPWRSLAAVAAVMLGVALAFAVHVINASALDEFAQAVRSINGQPDLEVRAMHGSLPEGLYTQVVQHPQVAQASPWLELTALGEWPGNAGQAPASTPLQVLGADALLLPTMAPALMPQPWPAADRLAILAPATVFLNPAALQALGWPQTPQGNTLPTLQLRTATGTHDVQVAGTVAAGGPPVAVMDIAAAQDLFARHGQISRIDLQWQPGTQAKALADSLRALPGWPPQALLAAPGDATERISNLSRAYRVNLTVLALVALFTGAYLVFSVRALSVAQRAQQWALLAVLGATPRQRLLLVLAESAALGLAGSMAGVALGTALAAAALRLLGGDLGGGYFAGVQPALQWSLLAALGYGLLGVLAALVGGWWPARAAQQLAPAATLKGLGTASSATPRGLPGLCMLAAGAALTQVPPIAGVPLAAYVAVGLLLVGGIAVLPWGVGHLLAALQPLVAQRPLPLLALERARRMRGQAAMAVGGVVASLSLAVALTVMVGSFRGSVMQWLDVVLPSPLYARSALHAAGGDAALLPPGLADAAAQLPSLARVQTQRTSPLQLHPAQPALTVISRPLGDAPAQHLPLVGNALPVPQGQVGVYVSEATAHLYQRTPGQAWPELSQAFFKGFSASALENQAPSATFFIAGIWRDYARQTGAVVIDSADYQALTGDARISDLALWPREGADLAQLQADLQRLAAQGPDTAAQPLEFSSAATIRERSLHIFDRSFAVTYWLQAVAIGIGLFGVAASFSAQVLARRKEFGLLAHLGLTRRQILTVVAGEGAAWTALGAAAGLLLGLAVAVVLVHVVNPQSFYWTMELQIPALRLLALCAAVVGAGTATAWLAGRAAAGRDAVMAVKEDW
jgi:putative ABC transport system permease protein